VLNRIPSQVAGLESRTIVLFLHEKGRRPEGQRAEYGGGNRQFNTRKNRRRCNTTHDCLSFVLCLFVSPKSFSNLLVTSANTSDMGITAKARFGSSISSNDLGVGRFL
jgi:hypothetical protein